MNSLALYRPRASENVGQGLSVDTKTRSRLTPVLTAVVVVLTELPNADTASMTVCVDWCNGIIGVEVVDEDSGIGKIGGSF
jgi:hypothetical protein